VKGNTVNIVVFTNTEFPISVGEQKLPANTNQTALELPSDYPYSHLVSDVPFLTTSANTFDKIIVQGNRIQMMGIFSFYDGTLTKGWNDDIETEYKNAAGTDETANDIFREADHYDSVFTTFKVPRTWDFTLGNGAGTAATKQNVAPNPQEDGNIRFDTPGAYWIGQKHFERALPLRVDFDYTLNPPKDNTVAGTEDEWMLPLVWMFDAYSGPNHTRDNKWHAVWKQHATNQDLKNITVHLLDNELGFRLEVSPKHYLALNHWTGAQQGSVEPEIDYTTLAITAAFKTDQRQKIVMYNQSGQTEAMKTLTLTIEHAECWLAASPDTPVGIDTKGNPLLINGDNLILRNDVSLLKAVAALASAWYGVKRQAVEIPIHSVGMYCELGTLLTSISSIYQRESVHTVVTRRHVDFKSRQTVISTGYHEMDFAQFAGKLRDS
jgi:hypothetical protein